MNLEPLTALTFSMAGNPGVYALLLGSGVSRAAQIPTGWDIITDLSNRLAAAAGETPADPVAWFSEVHGAAPQYSALLEALASTPGERRALLHAYIEPSPGDLDKGRRRPTAAHRAVARLVRDGMVRVIVTTNFDRLLETAIREDGVEPVVVSSEDGVAGMVPLIHQRCLILKVHGDYLDTRILNTNGELEDYGPNLNALLDRIFDEHGLIVCGWSGEWDPALRRAIQRAPNRRYPLFWASRREPAGLAADLVQARGGRWLPIDSADALFEELQRGVETQRRLAEPHPLSVNILAAQARGLLAGPKPGVALGQLLQAEARLADRTLQKAEVYGQRSIAATQGEEFTRRVDVFEGAMMRLVRLVFLVGRWGDGDETREVERLVRTFNRTDLQNGLVLWIALGGYPAVLLWHAYGLGLAAGDRLTVLHGWLGLPLPDRYQDGEKPAVRQLFGWAYEGGRSGGGWQSRLGTGSREPFEDYLRSWLRAGLSVEFFSLDDFDEALERFELLATLRYLEDQVTLEHLATPPAPGQWTMPAPVGGIRIAGFGQSPPAITAMKRADERDRLAGAGFGGGRTDWLDLALDRIAQYVSYPFAR